MTTNSKPKIVLLSLERQPWMDEMYGALFTALRDKADVTEITTPEEADDLFLTSTNKPNIIIATDASLTNAKFRKQQDAAVTYVRSHGGTLLLACLFSSFAPPPDIKTFFAALGLAWESGDYHRTEFSLNTSNTSVPNSAKALLATRYSQKALHLQHMATRDALYLPTASSFIQSRVFGPGPVGDRRQTPAALGRCGMGWVGYVGDVNGEVETEGVVLAMCGLL